MNKTKKKPPQSRFHKIVSHIVLAQSPAVTTTGQPVMPPPMPKEPDEDDENTASSSSMPSTPGQ